MKPKFKVYVKNQLSHTADEKKVYDQITKKISGMYSRIFDANSDIPFNVYLFLSQQPNNALEWITISDKISYNLSLDQFNALEREAFRAELGGVLRNLYIPNSIPYISLVISNNTMKEEDFFLDQPNSGVEDEKARIKKFHASDPLFALDDVIMNDDERIALYKALAIIEHKDLIFNKWNFKRVDSSTKSILCFHGAPGTGKTMCAHGVAKYLGKKILICSYNQVQSMYVGEGVKNLKACFDAAEEQDAVLFIDEADTFLSKRLPASNENSKIYNSMSNELFQYVESFNGCLIFASNHIQDFDPAILSRIIQPIEFRIPDKKARVEIITRMLSPQIPLQISEKQLEELSISIDGFSGRDIRKALLLFLSAAAYHHKTLNKESDDKIALSFGEFKESFNQVKKEKERLRKSKNIEREIATIAIENHKKEERLMTCAALALWSGGELSSKGEILFKEMSKKYDTRINIHDKDSFCSLQELTSQAISMQEKIQLLDMAIRVIAAEGAIIPAKESFISDLSASLGVVDEKKPQILTYLTQLCELETNWEDICKGIGKNEIDVLADLKKEYSEGAAYYHLAQIFEHGSTKYIMLHPDKDKASYYFAKAKEIGYVKEDKI